MNQPANPEQADMNFILAALPAEDYRALSARLRPAELGIKQLLYQAGQPIREVYFPTTAVLSMVCDLDGEASIEVGTVGREGMVGLPVFLGVPASPNTVFAQIPGTALRLPADELRTVLAADGALHRQLHRYIQALMVQLSQNVACNRLHTTEERAARWLLMTADRVGSLQFTLTQEFLAQMLGVRRATVSLTAGLLHNAGLISYRRGLITIDDRDGLQDAACDCYRILHNEFNNLTHLD
jgi:CRP-like cAMP-binding protein